MRQSISLSWFFYVRFSNNKSLLLSCCLFSSWSLIILPFLYCRKPTLDYVKIVGSKTIRPSPISNAISIFFSTFGNLCVTSKISYLWECNIVKYSHYERSSSFFYLWISLPSINVWSHCAGSKFFYLHFSSVHQPQRRLLLVFRKSYSS